MSPLLEVVVMDVNSYRIKGPNGYIMTEKIRVRYKRGDVVDRVVPGTSTQRRQGNLDWRKSVITGQHILVAQRDFTYWYTTSKCYNCHSWFCKQFMDRGVCRKT